MGILVRETTNVDSSSRPILPPGVGTRTVVVHKGKVDSRKVDVGVGMLGLRLVPAPGPPMQLVE